MRTLLYVPVVHALSEMGARGARYVLELEAAIGSQKTAEHLTALEEFWQILPRVVLDHVGMSCFRWEQIHVFADGLPRATRGNPDAYVSEWLARYGSDEPMAGLMSRLQLSGATVHGTEDEALVLAHSEHLMKSVRGESMPDGRAISLKYTGLRDACIAMHMSRTVPDGHLAILLMGAMHCVDNLLEQEGTFKVERIDLMDSNLLPLSHPLS